MSTLVTLYVYGVMCLVLGFAIGAAWGEVFPRTDKTHRRK